MQFAMFSRYISGRTALVLETNVLKASTLDTQKAFDVIDHNSLLRKLYLDGIRSNDWLLLKYLYADCSSRIKWAGELSDPININQGVRQGGVFSTGHYKKYNNSLLLQLENKYCGMKLAFLAYHISPWQMTWHYWHRVSQICRPWYGMCSTLLAMNVIVFTLQKVIFCGIATRKDRIWNWIYFSLVVESTSQTQLHT